MQDQEPPRCPYCKRAANEILDVIISAQENGLSPEALAREDGTYSEERNQFCCDDCYIRLGTPSSSRGWRAGDPIS